MSYLVAGNEFSFAIVFEGSVGFLLGLGEIDVVANFPLECHVGHEALHGLWVETRRVGGIGVAVRIAVCAVEQVNEVVAVLDSVVHGQLWLEIFVSDLVGLLLDFSFLATGAIFGELTIVTEGEPPLFFQAQRLR